MDWLEDLKERYPYYEKKGVVLLNADTKELIKTVPNEVFDAIITDPPYGLSFAPYDESSYVFFALEEEFYRVAKPNTPFVFWWSTKKLLEASKLKRFAYVHLMIALFQSTCPKTPVGDRKYAPIMFFAKGKPRLNCRRADVLPAAELPPLAVKVKSGDFKPTFVQSMLVSMFTKENSLVFEPFAGYGTLPFVCSLWNRRCLAVEKDPIRFEIACMLLKRGTLPGSIPEIEDELQRGIRQNTLLELMIEP